MGGVRRCAHRRQRSHEHHLAPRHLGVRRPHEELTPLRSEFVAGDSVRPAISGDGCVVAFVTEIAYDLFRDDDTGARWDVYRTVLPACEDGAADGGAAGGAGAGVDDTSDAAGGA
ncbi:MAG: hypothetical protein R2713_11550 [Ilumatobacteraceae bacterium]